MPRNLSIAGSNPDFLARVGPGRLAAYAPHTLGRHELSADRWSRVLLVGAGTWGGRQRAGVAYRRWAVRGGTRAPTAITSTTGVSLSGGARASSGRTTQSYGRRTGRSWPCGTSTGDGPDAPVVVLPHCWGCSHEIWLPVARRLREQGFRVVLYDQRGHGASTRGTAPLTIETLAHDLTAVLDATDVHDAVLAGHSMGGMTIMSLATHRPDVLKERAKATVLVATAATSLGDRLGAGGAGRQRTGRVAVRHAGDAVEERTRLRPRSLRREPGPRRTWI